MKNKLVFRIFGALASALIIVSVFIPFISVTGYSQSLWQTNSTTGSLYLPILIIVFGAIGVLVFSLNIKTELAYSSVGALLFFLMTQIIPMIDHGSFNTLGVGFYCLVVGTILTAIMAFLCNLRTKKRVIEQPEVEQQKEVSLLNQIDKLYDNNINSSSIQQINNLDNVIKPIQTQTNLDNSINPISEQVIPSLGNQSTISREGNPVIFEFGDQSNNLQNIQPNVQPQVVQPNPMISEFGNQPNNLQNIQPNVQPQVVQPNPVISEFGNQPNNLQNIQPNVQPQEVQPNPVVSEFGNQPNNLQNVQPNVQPQVVKPNPVVSEFSNSGMGAGGSTLGQSFLTSQSQNSESLVSATNSNNNNNNNLDIFG